MPPNILQGDFKNKTNGGDFMLYVILKTVFLFPYLLYRSIKEKRGRGVHLFGIYGFFGLPGKGKTMAMCQRLRTLRMQYGEDIYIMTNFCYDDEDYSFTSWKDLLREYDKPLVVAWDEVQNEFNSRDFKTFPIALLTILTQVRKKNGIQILYTAQRWHFVDKNFRSLSFGCYECNTICGCFTITKLYDPVDYDNLCSNSDYDKRRRIKPIKVDSFIQTDDLRECYDSYKMLETAKSKEYMGRDEVAEIYRLGE